LAAHLAQISTTSDHGACSFFDAIVMCSSYSGTHKGAARCADCADGTP
jgi:hypothetical protein